jgi:diguanylate cyclase (GGDEF)-like protein
VTLSARRTDVSLKTGLMTGFSLILLLLIGLTMVGLARMADINRQLQGIVDNDIVKRELAFSVNSALHERLVSMHTLIVMTDPFDREEESHRLREYGVKFLEGRKKLEVLAQTPEEEYLLRQIREQSIKTRPLTEQAIEDALAGKTAQALVTIRTKTIPGQNLIAQHVNEYIGLQRRETEKRVAHAAASYARARSMMLLLGSAATGLGILIGVVVIRNSNRQASLLQRQAMYDNLTNLPNRVLFADRLQQAIRVSRREQRPFALIIMDLDRFKEINDTLGHHAGDQVLLHVGNCVRSCLRESDTVARMGGDEFAILLSTVNGLDGAVAATKKILRSLDEPVEIARQQIEIGASLGIVLCPEHGEEPEALMRAADAAMYAAKKAHGGYKVYSKGLGQGVDDRQALQGELRHAIAHDELVLYFQPQIDFKSNRISGVEALVRWQHPKHGLLAPDRFILLAEQTGMIKPLTYYVLRSALRHCEGWQRAGLDLSMSVNISAINIQDPEFPDQVAEILKEFSVPPACLELEITETAVMSEPVRAVECIKKLSALGLLIAIDDFGTGYSSMSYLKELLVAKIKIDKSFVTDMANNRNDAVIVRSTVELGHSLGLKVVAEGVETQVVWDKLSALGCDDAQGYYMSHPLSADGLTDWLQQSPWGKKRQAADA